MPLPPTPKRPLGPPALFAFRDVSIRTRADAVEASGSWDEFLDDVADLYVEGAVRQPGDFLHLVERLVPPANLAAHREDLGRRLRARQDENLAILRDVLDAAPRPRRGLLARLLRRAA
ncbi:hypothetical protein [Methylobacterium oryzae]|uniref:hypothetical protein n=1 Tax=Methylobacterium oryzae TaxID=334852 RepID=UPI002F35ADE4